MSQAPELAPPSAIDDTRARLLALEMVTVAALNGLLTGAPAMQATMDELGNPGRLPDRPGAGDREFLEHVQANVARLAAGVTGKL